MSFMEHDEIMKVHGAVDVRAEEGDTLANRMLEVLEHYQTLEAKLDELDDEDFFGTEGWRHYFGLPE